MATTQPQTRYTYSDLESFPDDNLRREIIDGELIVTAAPRLRHQEAVAYLTHILFVYGEQHGGKVYPAPTDVFFADDNVVEPDVIFVSASNRDRLEGRYVRGAPDLVIEVSSPSTRRLELVRKRELYQRFGVPEYWYVDLDADRVEVFVQAEGAFDTSLLVERGQVLESETLPGLTVSVDELLGEAGDAS